MGFVGKRFGGLVLVDADERARLPPTGISHADYPSGRLARRVSECVLGETKEETGLTFGESFTRDHYDPAVRPVCPDEADLLPCESLLHLVAGNAACCAQAHAEYLQLLEGA